MDTAYHVTVEETPQPEVERIVHGGLGAFNDAQVGEVGFAKLVVTLRGPDGAIAGGLLGEFYYQWLAIETLWVREDLRRQGHGRALMATAEREAVRRKCVGIHVDTMDFQARPFYEKQGYTVFGELNDVPPGHTRYWLKKRLR